MILTDKLYKRILLLIISGALTGLSVTFPKIGILCWITLIPFAVFMISAATDKKRRLISLYGYGFIFFMSFYLVNYYWFINLYPLEFIDGMPRSAALFIVFMGTVGTSLLQAVTGALIFPIFALIARSRLGQKLSFLQPVLIAALWTALEWSYTLGELAFPWSRLAISQTDLPIGIQTASLFGSYFISFLIVLVNSYAAYGLVGALTRGDRARSSAIRLSTLICCSALIFQYGAGLCLWLFNAPSDDRQTVRVAAIQGSITPTK